MDDQKNVSEQSNQLLYKKEFPLAEELPSLKLTPESIRLSKPDMSVQEFLETIRVMESRMTETLSEKILRAIKPLTQSKMDILEDELKGYIYLFTEIQKSFFGTLLLRKLLIKMEKEDNKEAETAEYSGLEQKQQKRKFRQVAQEILKKI